MEITDKFNEKYESTSTDNLVGVYYPNSTTSTPGPKQRQSGISCWGYTLTTPLLNLGEISTS